MFNKLLSSTLKRTSVKVTASSSFLSAIADESQSGSIDKNRAIHAEKYEDILASALNSLKRFTQSGGIDGLSFKEAASKLEEAQKIRPSYAAPYFYLSWLFLFIKDVPLALKYFNVAKVLDPELEGIEELKEEIQNIVNSKPVNNQQSFKPQPLPNAQVTKPEIPSQGEVFKPQPLQGTLKRASSSYSQYNKF